MALIKRDDTQLTIAFSAEALQLKESALSSAALIGRVTSAEENSLAVGAQAQLAGLRRSVEKARVEAKAPVIAYGKKIDSSAEQFIADIVAEEGRISKLTGDFAQLEAAKARAAEAAARLEAERIERERLAELTRIAQEQAKAAAAVQKQQDEAARKAREATNAAEREEAQRLQLEIDRQKKLAEAASHDALDAVNAEYSDKQAQVQAAAPAPIRAEGQRVKPDIEITVTDIWLLARAHPTCVKMTPVLTEIKSLVNAGVKVAGITTKEVFKSTVTTARQPAAIEA